MWKILRKFRHSGFPFRRQHPIEFYIANFYCHKLRLVIEVDGETHTEKEIQEHDEGRTGDLPPLTWERGNEGVRPVNRENGLGFYKTKVKRVNQRAIGTRQTAPTIS